jgi:hypothetical protein
MPVLSNVVRSDRDAAPISEDRDYDDSFKIGAIHAWLVEHLPSWLYFRLDTDLVNGTSR